MGAWRRGQRFFRATAMLVLGLTLASPAAAQPLPAGQSVRRFEEADPQVLNPDYLLYLPEGANEGGEGVFPVLLFLHGSGERGSDIEIVKRNGPPGFLDTRADFPFITVSPQLPAERDWDSASLIDLLDHVMTIVPADPRRVYLTGLSRGGHATWRLGAEYPERFAAIAPVAGRGDPATACALADMPVWSFHGDADDIVLAADNAAMVEAVEACGGEPRFTLYEGVGHASWIPAYEDPALYDWLLAHRLPHGTRKPEIEKPEPKKRVTDGF